MAIALPDSDRLASAYRFFATFGVRQQCRIESEQPVLGYGQMKQNIVIALGWRKGLIQRLLCLITLLVNELPAYLVRHGNMTDGLQAR